jgi:transposase
MTWSAICRRRRNVAAVSKLNRYFGRSPEPLHAHEKVVVIPHPSATAGHKHAPKARHLIENFFCKLKQYRAIATRYGKTARNFLVAIHFAAAIIWLN